MPDGEG